MNITNQQEVYKGIVIQIKSIKVLKQLVFDYDYFKKLLHETEMFYSGMIQCCQLFKLIDYHYCKKLRKYLKLIIKNVKEDRNEKE